MTLYTVGQPRVGFVGYWTRYVILCLPADDRQLPQFPTPGGLFGGLVGGLVNQAVKGLAKEMQKTAAQSRSVSETAAMRIQQSQRIRERLGPVTVGPAMSQSMSTSNINGRVNKTISLMMPVYGSGELPVAQAQVTQVENSSQVESCRISVSQVNMSHDAYSCAGDVHVAHARQMVLVWLLLCACHHRQLCCISATEAANWFDLV
jgi:hypothetical protein